MAERLTIKGQVQGVGFRPTVWRLATELGLTGDVRNTGDGVEVRIWGEECDRFCDHLEAALPSLARIDSIEASELHGHVPDQFVISKSEHTGHSVAVTPDVATCPDCLREIRDPTDRRYRYAFNNCTNCGPRFSITLSGPYDRSRTSMAPFVMCTDCEAEYHDPSNRRFHAQPVACPTCGPEVWIEDLSNQIRLESTDPFFEIAKHLLDGRIVAIRGLGGTHLACDATNEKAISLLRERKARRTKSLAIMARDLKMVRTYAELCDIEEALLQNARSPIVLLKKYGSSLPETLAPGLNRLGFMLPYTPLHHLLYEHIDRPLVMTSGNQSGQPQCLDNDEIRTRLSGLADFALMHNRDIVTRIDDSVVRVDQETPRVIRRARGYAPEAIQLPDDFPCEPSVLAMGSELKNTVCLVQDGQAILSQHMGDLEDAFTNEEQRHTLSLLTGLFRHDAEHIVVDAHPDYLSTQFGHDIAEGRPVIETQHHHAHIAACMAENGVLLSDGPVLGIALDGLGLGDDGTLWGGEFLIADYVNYRRVGHLKPYPLVGGAAAVREPWRNAFAHITTGMGWEAFADRFSGLELCDKFAEKPLVTLEAMITNKVNSPLSSSCGRLFDTAAALMGLAWERQGYEGEAAMTLEAMCDQSSLQREMYSGYPFVIISGSPRQIDPSPAIEALLEDLKAGENKSVISARFHIGLASAVGQLAGNLAQASGLKRIALSGGCFQNATLFALLHHYLDARNFAVLSHSTVPTNDGGLSLGQAAIALARIRKGT